mgnify:CR=1 FL=1
MPELGVNWRFSGLGSQTVKRALAVVAGETEKLELRQDRHTEPGGRPLAVSFNRIGNVYNFSQIGAATRRQKLLAFSFPLGGAL